MSLKDSLLEIHALSSFTTYTPKQVLDTYKQLKQFLNNNVNNISNIEYYNLLELNFYLALIIGNDIEAKTCLNRITDHFDEGSSQRIAVLQATYLSTYNNTDGVEYLLKRDKEELTTLKKRISLTKSFIKPQEYIQSLNSYLKFAPLDVETAAELAETYNKYGHYDKSIYVYEDTLLLEPFNYVIFGKLGGLYHKLYKQSQDSKHLESSIKQYLRSVELSKNFVEGWSGIYVVSNEISKLNEKKLKDISVDYTALKTLAESRLNDIIKSESATLQNIELAKKILSI